MKLLAAIYRWLNFVIEKIAMLLIIIITSVTMYRVIMRFFFNATPSWTEEFTCILIIWISLLGLAIGVRERLHLSITLFYDKLNLKLRKKIDVLIYAGQFFLGVFLVIEGSLLSAAQASATMSVVRLHPFTDQLMPNSILYLGLPVSGALIVIYTVIQIFDKKEIFKINSMDTEDIN